MLQLMALPRTSWARAPIYESVLFPEWDSTVEVKVLEVSCRLQSNSFRFFLTRVGY